MAKTNQSQLNALEALLRVKMERPCPCSYEGLCEVCELNNLHGKGCKCEGIGTITDPKLQAAWELITNRYPEEQNWRVRDVYDWPDGAVRGLLEQVAETTKIGILYQVQGQSRRFVRPLPDGGRRTTFYEDAATLGKAIMGALNE